MSLWAKREFHRGDVIAGVTVAVMLVPQGMAYAMLAGLPPVVGLYASIVPVFIYGLLGTSGQLAVGPVAMVSLLVAAGVGAVGFLKIQRRGLILAKGAPFGDLAAQRDLDMLNFRDFIARSRYGHVKYTLWESTLWESTLWECLLYYKNN